MNKDQLVTVFIPMYNSENYIKETLESIIKQTYTNLEILIIDDGSTDKSVEIVRTFNDSRIKLLLNESNKGIPYTRNRGLKNAKGKYIALMDADDIAIKTRIESQVKYLDNHKDVDVVASNIQYICNNWIKNLIYKVNTYFKKGLSDKQVKMMMIFKSPIANPSAMIRKKTITDLNLVYDENCFIAQDYSFWVEMIIKDCKLIVLKNVLLKYRTDHMNITKLSSLNKKNMRKNIVFSIKNRILSHFGVNISEDEKYLFFEFFGEESIEKISRNDIKNIKEIIEKIKLFSDELDKEIFESILRERVRASLSRSKLSLKEKLNYYKEIVENSRMQDNLYIFSRHFINFIMSN